jgi:hypothetical protein
MIFTVDSAGKGAINLILHAQLLWSTRIRTFRQGVPMFSKKILVVLTTLLLASSLLACSGGSPSLTQEDGDTPEYNGKPDGDLELDFEMDEETGEPCVTGSARCADDSDVAVLICNEDHGWDYHHSCDAGRVCEAGFCVDPLPDGDFPEDGDFISDGDTDADWHCTADLDCGYGSGCDPSGPGDGCVNRMECRSDDDCAEGLICYEMANWKACIPSQNECEVLDDCDYGYACVMGDEGWNVCQDANECYNTVECEGDNLICAEGGHWRVCQPDGKFCASTDDCDFGYKCYTDLPQPVCILENSCSIDSDCGVMQRCVIGENWKSCQIDLGPTWCTNDEACPEGEYCDTLSCKSKAQCSTDRDCETGNRCLEQDGYKQCIPTPPCTQDAECGFGYQCQSGTCAYANQCKNDGECPALQACKAVGNYTVCQFDTPSICTSDDGCDADEYCDTFLAVGECRSRNQCFIDEDCGEGMVCESNGHYTTCVADSPKACWFDFQCPTDWVCASGECKPIYEGTCVDIEGRWTVLISDCTLITTTQVYEFVPTNGCNGNIHLGETQIPAGNFTETSESHYNVQFTWQQCEGTVTLDSLLNLQCGSCSVQLAKW